MFNWYIVHDPEKEIVISNMTFDFVEGYMDPQDVQDMIDKYGIENAVDMINCNHRRRTGKNAIMRHYVQGQKILSNSKDLCPGPKGCGAQGCTGIY